MLKKNCYFIMCIFMLLSSCTSDPRDKQVLKEKPNLAEIIGTWKITKASVENIKRHVQSLQPDSYIRFTDDRHYVARNFPLVKHQEKEQITFANSEGTWVLLCNNGCSITISFADGFGSTWDMRGDKPYYLTNDIGEPGSPDSIVLEKVSSADMNH